MSRVTMYFDDESKVDFNDAGDAVYHATRQGTSGVTAVKDEDGKNVYTRKQLDALVRRAAEEGVTDPKDIHKLTKEG